MGKRQYRSKTSLTFDETKRKEFLTGFRKRKDERRKQAREKLDQQLKEERIRIKTKKREAVQHRLEEIHNIKMEHDVYGTACVDVNENTIDMPNHTVTVVESDLFNPVTDIFMGENKHDDKTDDTAGDQTDKPVGKFNARRAAENISKLSKTKQKLNSKKKQNLPSQRASKKTKKFLQKKKHLKGIHK
ncbi:unnamed protein product [Clavelina lepadiformis]|uniref:Nucleolar protein 12 n=1 Tax=Clavelina lepadiformis TaxID=159417 RepID=A0ABP0GRE1_CLALP